MFQKAPKIFLNDKPLATLRLILLGVLTCAGGCATAPTAPSATRQTRDLTAAEKDALTRSLAQTMKDPDAARFKWAPIVLAERDGVTDYCGLVNGKNSYGAYTGFTPFYAHLKKNDKDQFTQGTVRLIASDPVNTKATNDLCVQFGYGDISDAR